MKASHKRRTRTFWGAVKMGKNFPKKLANSEKQITSRRLHFSLIRLPSASKDQENGIALYTATGDENKYPTRNADFIILFFLLQHIRENWVEYSRQMISAVGTLLCTLLCTLLFCLFDQFHCKMNNTRKSKYVLRRKIIN